MWGVEWGWNGYRNKSQPRKVTLERKLLPPLLPFHYGLVTGADNTNPFNIALLQVLTTQTVSI